MLFNPVSLCSVKYLISDWDFLLTDMDFDVFLNTEMLNYRKSQP
jgi:hypothetical protein